ncbi:MAG: TerB family tellurite resistance protein [Parvibaculales bacterium]
MSSVPLPFIFGAAIITIGLLTAFVLIKRRSQKSTVFEKVEKSQEKQSGGQVLKQREAGFLNIVYGLAAAMVVADGQVDKAEIEIAEQLGKKLIPNFDDDAFVMVVRGHAKLPPFTDMIDTMAPLLPLEAKAEIFQYLQAIATADGKITPDEKHYIHHAEVTFGLDKL